MPPHFTHFTLLNSYRVFLSKLTTKAHLEENRLRHGQRNSKLLMRLRDKQLIVQSAIDPFRIFRRLKASMGNLSKAPILPTPKILYFKKKSRLKAKEVEKVLGSEGLMRSSLILALGGISKLFMNYGNETKIDGKEHLLSALNRIEGQPLITVSNHTGAMDDPLIISSIVPTSVLFHPEKTRWTLCATDRCFKNSMLTSFFRAAKVLPIERGAGLNQLGMKAAELCLNQGGWIHIFPEGTRSKSGELLPPRLGIGKLVANCDQLPLVVPFIHSGMENIMLPGSMLPRPGNKISVVVGEPISFKDIIETAAERGWTDFELYQAISQKIGIRMAELWSNLEKKPLPSWAKSMSTATHFSTLHSKSVSKLTTREDFGPSFRETLESNFLIRKQVERGYYVLSEYLEYCKLRFQQSILKLCI